MAFSRGLRNHAVPLLVTSESRDPPQIQRDKIEPPLADGPWLDDTGREQEGRRGWCGRLWKTQSVGCHLLHLKVKCEIRMCSHLGEA